MQHVSVVVSVTVVQSEEGVETPPGGCVLGIIASNVPLSYEMRLVAETFQVLRKQSVLEVKAKRLTRLDRYVLKPRSSASMKMM